VQTRRFKSVVYVSVPRLRPRVLDSSSSKKFENPDIENYLTSSVPLEINPPAYESSNWKKSKNARVADYLTSFTPLEINPPALNLQLPRKFLWRAYGGNDHQFLQFIKEDMNPSGPFKRRLVFPMLECNPLMPHRPGDPGLVYTPRHEILSNGPWTLFCKPSSKPIWEYLGEYESEICGKMSASQFMYQPGNVKCFLDLFPPIWDSRTFCP
jgi:hypothetical protein